MWPSPPALRLWKHCLILFANIKLSWEFACNIPMSAERVNIVWNLQIHAVSIKSFINHSALHSCKIEILVKLLWIELIGSFLCRERDHYYEQLQNYLFLIPSLEVKWKLTFKRSNTFSATYFCWMVAPFCWTLSGWTHKVAFLYTFLTAALVIRSVNDTGFQPDSGQRTYKNIPKQKQTGALDYIREMLGKAECTLKRFQTKTYIVKRW